VIGLYRSINRRYPRLGLHDFILELARHDFDLHLSEEEYHGECSFGNVGTRSLTAAICV
jgi:hypothetical protein